MHNIAHALTHQFYAWEKRGRGVITSLYPCELEPPFESFYYHFHNRQYPDDGRRPTIVSTIFDAIKGKKQSVSIPVPKETGIIPYPAADYGLHAFTIVLPKGFRTPTETTFQLLIMLANCRKPLSYEIKATQKAISIHLVCAKIDQLFIRSQCRAYFPDITLHDDAAHIENVIAPDTLTGIVDFSLAEEFMRPMQFGKGFDLDPYISLFGILEQLRPGETALLQVQFVHAHNAWAKSVLSSVTTYRGECFFMDAPEMLPLAKEKVSMPLFAVTVKLAVQAGTEQRVFSLLDKVSDCITVLSSSQANALVLQDDNEYRFQDRLDDVTLRQTHRLGMLLNVRELATLVHFPSSSIHCSKLLRSVTRTKAAPDFTKGNRYVLGKNVFQNIESEVSISEAQRMRHMHIIGATGTGKSTLLLNLLYQDITLGDGFAVLDPHGDLIDTILTIIPAKRKNDVVIVDPFDTEFPVKCNILHAQTDIEKELISSDLVALFKRFSTSWGDQMNSVFANAILAFVESSKGGTLLDLQKFLIEKSYRDDFLKTVQDPQIVYYWQKEFPLLKSSSIGPILTKLDAFLRPRVTRNMVSQKESLPIAELMNTKKIILIKLSQGLIGAENSYLLGALLVSKIHQAAMARQLQSKHTRLPFYLYIDEFQHFITPSMSDILSGARKYQLGLVLVHQSMEQVSKYDNELAHALLANAGTRICFRVGNADAKKMAEGLSYFQSEDLQNLSIGEAIVRINRNQDDFSLQVKPQDFPFNLQIVRDDILSQSRQKYASPIEILKPTEKVASDSINKVADEISITAAINQSSELPQDQQSQPQTSSEAPVVDGKDKELSVHKSLQTMIKLMGESRGYKALLEMPIEKSGKVDVVLEKNNKRIACEVSNTTDINWELHNIEKCLNHGFDLVVSISKTEKFLSEIKRRIVETFDNNQQKRIRTLSLGELAAYLDSLEDFGGQEAETTKGYRVKVKYSSAGADGRAKQELVNRFRNFKRNN